MTVKEVIEDVARRRLERLRGEITVPGHFVVKFVPKKGAVDEA